MMTVSMTTWDNFTSLKSDLEMYVRQIYTRNEILSFVQRDYPQFSKSIRTLDRRLKAFNINYSNKSVSIEGVTAAVQQELQDPGKLLGYCAMQLKIRQAQNVNVPRQLVYDVIYDLDPEGLENWAPCLEKKKRKENSSSPGPGMVYSLDGHDKVLIDSDIICMITLWTEMVCFERRLRFFKKIIRGLIKHKLRKPARMILIFPILNFNICYRIFNKFSIN